MSSLNKGTSVVVNGAFLKFLSIFSRDMVFKNKCRGNIILHFTENVFVVVFS